MKRQVLKREATSEVPACYNPAPKMQYPSWTGQLPALTQSITRKTTMADINLSGLNIDQLTELVSKAQTEVASREGKRRKDLRSELERRIVAAGYKLGDIFPELASGTTSGSQRQKRPAKYRNPQNPEETWAGIGRTPKWVQAILSERGIDVAAFKAIPMYQIHT